jgi:hypothetical protein
MLIVSCGDKDSEVALIANHDSVTFLWSNALSKDVLENDFMKKMQRLLLLNNRCMV